MWFTYSDSLISLAVCHQWCRLNTRKTKQTIIERGHGILSKKSRLQDYVLILKLYVIFFLLENRLSIASKVTIYKGYTDWWDPSLFSWELDLQRQYRQTNVKANAQDSLLVIRVHVLSQKVMITYTSTVE